jgi:hypothetical protein
VRTLILGLTAAAVFLTAGCFNAETEQGQPEKEREAPPIEVTAETDRTRAPVSQPVTFRITVRRDKNVQVDMPDAGTNIAGLRIVDFGEEGPEQIDNRIHYTKWYELKADIEGSYIIPAVAVGYRTADGEEKTIKTPQIFLEFAAAEGGAEQQQDIIDIKPLQTASRDLTPYLIAGGIAFGLAAAGAGVFLYVRRRRRGRQEPVKPAYLIALEELDRLKKDNLVEKGGFAEHYFRLSDICRRYIENRFFVPAVEQTTQELIPTINGLQGMSEAVKGRTKSFLINSDLIKFAKHTPSPGEIQAGYDDVETIIEQTKEPEEESGPKAAA